MLFLPMVRRIPVMGLILGATRRGTMHCPEKKKRKSKQQLEQFAGSVEIVAIVDELASQIETAFSMVSCLLTNTISHVGCYVHNKPSGHVILNQKIFNRF